VVGERFVKSVCAYGKYGISSSLDLNDRLLLTAARVPQKDSCGQRSEHTQGTLSVAYSTWVRQHLDLGLRTRPSKQLHQFYRGTTLLQRRKMWDCYRVQIKRLEKFECAGAAVLRSGHVTCRLHCDNKGAATGAIEAHVVDPTVLGGGGKYTTSVELPPGESDVWVDCEKELFRMESVVPLVVRAELPLVELARDARDEPWGLARELVLAAESSSLSVGGWDARPYLSGGKASFRRVILAL
jgi:hypothetical protein